MLHALVNQLVDSLWPIPMPGFKLDYAIIWTCRKLSSLVKHAPEFFSIESVCSCGGDYPLGSIMVINIMNIGERLVMFVGGFSVITKRSELSAVEGPITCRHRETIEALDSR